MATAMRHSRDVVRTPFEVRIDPDGPPSPRVSYHHRLGSSLVSYLRPMILTIIRVRRYPQNLEASSLSIA